MRSRVEVIVEESKEISSFGIFQCIMTVRARLLSSSATVLGETERVFGGGLKVETAGCRLQR